MAAGSSRATESAERLRSLAQELRASGRWPQPDSPQEAELLAACLEQAAQALAPAQVSPIEPAQASPPPPAASLVGHALILHADGGSRGNPGPAGAGAALLDPAGHQLAAWHRYLGIATNNVAEYQALILGLQGALELGVTELLVRLDSELLVRQLQGRYQVKSPQLKPLFGQARALAARLGRVSFQHIPREQNAIADRLANLAMDQGGG